MQWWIPAAVVGVPAVYLFGRKVSGDVLAAYDAIYQRLMVAQMDRLTVQEKANQIALKNWTHLPPDERGRIGIMTRQDGAILNFDTGTMLDRDWNIVRVDAERERMEHLIRLLEARGGAAGGEPQDLLPDPVPALPEFVTPEQVSKGTFSYRRLILGKTESGVYTADMADLVHFAVGGSSGWGKSVMLRWIVYQLLRSVDPVQMALIDLEGVTLAPFASADRVLWPLADTERDAALVLAELIGEMDRRKELYGQYVGVDSLYLYNERAIENGKDPLQPIVVAVDEATSFFEDRSVEGHLRTLACRARKYGVWLVMAGQDWKSTSLDTTIRNMIGVRIHFRAQSPSQSRVLLGVSGAENLEVKGRALAMLPGEKMMEIQTPFLKHSDIRGLREGGPVNPMPTPEEKALDKSDEDIRALWDSFAGKGQKTKMCNALGRIAAGDGWRYTEQRCKRAGVQWD